MDLLTLLSKGAQIGKSTFNAVTKPLNLYGNIVTSKGYLLGDALTASQPNYKQAVERRASMLPQYRPDADADESYYEIGQMAKQRSDLMNAVAKRVRERGGNQADIERNWARMRNQGEVLNPADFIRGTGRVMPKQGGVQFSPRNYTMNALPMSNEQKMEKWLQSQGLMAMRED